jgi:hypothetical protein
LLWRELDLKGPIESLVLRTSIGANRPNERREDPQRCVAHAMEVSMDMQLLLIIVVVVLLFGGGGYWGRGRGYW